MTRDEAKRISLPTLREVPRTRDLRLYEAGMAFAWRQLADETRRRVKDEMERKLVSAFLIGYRGSDFVGEDLAARARDEGCPCLHCQR